MPKFKNIKDKLIETTKEERRSTENRLKNGNLEERINKAEAIVRSNEIQKSKVSIKVIRDAFTMLQTDVDSIKEIKRKCQTSGIDVNKSLIIRAGIQALHNLSQENLFQLIDKIEKVKVGRPKY